jgi:hypothetical protein
MNTYETTATVQDHGQLRLDGVPFATGTEVDVTISPKIASKEQVPAPDDQTLSSARDRMRELFQTIKGFRNSPRIPREELYDRGSLH